MLSLYDYLEDTNKRYGRILELMEEVDELDGLFEAPTLTEKKKIRCATAWYKNELEIL